ncbi:MAG: LPS export ABC transporter periplasmic protein LptC [Armatimonadetes bacterium]|nr:LPS export ABC transporter periplasmic protein LptC [Armatimonadota bacterium]
MLSNRKMKRNRALLAMVAGLLMLGGAGCHRRPSVPAQRPPEPPRPERPFEPRLRASGVSWTLSDPEGLPVWEVKAKSGSGAAAEGIAELREVRCNVYSAGKLALETQAAQVKADYSRKRLALYGGVDARTPDGTRSFHCERVSLTVEEEKRAVVDATGAVRLKVDGVEMEGARLITNPRLDEGQLLSQ